MTNTYQLKVITPEGVFLEKSVEFSKFFSPSGEVGVMVNHSPTVTQVDTGLFMFREEGDTTAEYFLSKGVLHILPSEMVILTPFIEAADQIDISRAEDSKKRAVERLDMLKDSNIDRERAKAALKRANVRLKVGLNPSHSE